MINTATNKIPTNKEDIIINSTKDMNNSAGREGPEGSSPSPHRGLHNKSNQKPNFLKKSNIYSIIIEDKLDYEPNFVMVPYRWFVLTLYCSYMFLIALNMQYIQPVAKSMEKGFDATNQMVNLSITLFSIANVVFCFPAIYL